MIQIVIFENSQQTGCLHRIVLATQDITHQTPHAYVRHQGAKYAKREAYDWSTQGRFASELALALDQQPFFWECQEDKPAKHLGRPPRHEGYAYWVTTAASAEAVYSQLMSGAIRS